MRVDNFSRIKMRNYLGSFIQMFSVDVNGKPRLGCIYFGSRKVVFHRKGCAEPYEWLFDEFSTSFNRLTPDYEDELCGHIKHKLEEGDDV